MEQIELSQLLPYIKTAFHRDYELPDYHIADCDFAEHTYAEICKTAQILPLTYYKVGEYGFTVTSPGLLYSFGINVNYRTKEILEQWFLELRELLITFEVCLHNKNTRAINHLLKQGMKIKDTMIILTI